MLSDFYGDSQGHVFVVSESPHLAGLGSKSDAAEVATVI